MIKKIIAIFIVVFLVSETNAQDAFTENWTKAYELALDNKFEEALQAFEPLLIEQPTNTSTHIQVSWCHMMLKNQELSYKHAFTAYYLDGLDFSTLMMASYFFYSMGGEKFPGKVFLDKSMWLLVDDATVQDVDKDIESMDSNGIDVTNLRRDFNNIKTGLAGRNRNWAAVMNSFTKGVENINAKDLAKAELEFSKALTLFDTESTYKHVGLELAYVMGTHYYSAGDSVYYLPKLRAAYDYFMVGNNSNVFPIQIINSARLLGEHYYKVGQYQKSFDILAKGFLSLNHLLTFKYTAQYQANFLNQYFLSALAIGEVEEAKDAAKMVTEITLTGYDEWYQTNGWYYLGFAWAEDAVKSKEYFQKSYDMAVKHGFEDLKIKIANELE